MIDHDMYKDDIDRASLHAFFRDMQEIVRRNADSIKSPLLAMSVEDKQQLIDKINAYLAFELSQNPRIKHRTVTATGVGMMYLSASDGQVLGAERISDGDVIRGAIDDLCAYSVPTAECLALADEECIPVIDETLSAVLLLQGTVYQTGLSFDGSFEIQHDLREFQIGLPLAHFLDIQ